MTSDSSHDLPRQQQSLCPVCGASSLKILTSSVVSYDVSYDPIAKELVVTGETYGDSDWDSSSRTDCPSCNWSGTLADCLTL